MKQMSMPKEEETMMPPAVNSVANPDASSFEPLAAVEQEVLNENFFRRMIAIERKRSERSKEPFLLMLLEADHCQISELNTATLDNIAAALLASSRGTDIVGWYKDKSTVGVIFTGIVVQDKNAVLGTILSRVKATLRSALVFEQLNQVSISFHFFPDEWDHGKHGNPINLVLYPDLLESGKNKQFMLLVKRAIDFLASALALMVLSPLFWLIAIAIKVSSKGPVFFSQTRIGQHGKP